MKSFYVGVGAYIEKEGKILILKRSPEKDVGGKFWEIVTGRLELEENPEEGVLREIREEVQLEVEVLLPVDTTFFYRGSKDFPMVLIFFWCRYKKGDVHLSWEHTEYKWITIEEAMVKTEELELFIKGFKMIRKLKTYLPENF